MSTDWNIRCVDCNSVHHFDDANHETELMFGLIKHAQAFAAMAPLLEGISWVWLRTQYGEVDTDWFAQHAAHRLVPHDEYGNDYGQCLENVTCGECGDRRQCRLSGGHTGPHQR